jgi:hypothetical protein
LIGKEKVDQARATLDNCIKNPTALLFLFIAGIYSSFYGSVSISKVKNYLRIEYKASFEESHKGIWAGLPYCKYG